MIPICTLAIFCANIKEAVRAAANISCQSVNRLFLFLEEAPDESDMDWLPKEDQFINLNNASEWNTDPSSLGIKAALMYAHGWNFLFTNARILPSNDELSQACELLEEQGVFQSTNLWGFSREYFVLNGPLTWKIPNVHTTNKIDVLILAQALRGVPSPTQAIVEALNEIADMSSVEYEDDQISTDENMRELSEALHHSYPHRPHGITWIQQQPTTLEELVIVAEKMPKHGRLVIISNANLDWAEQIRTHNTLQTDTGVFVYVCFAHAIIDAYRLTLEHNDKK